MWMRRVAAAAACLLLAAPSAAQPAGTLEGSVADSAGGALPGVTVTLTGALAPPGALQVTGPDGRFAFGMLPAADYVVVIVLPGFETQEIPVVVQPGGSASLAIVMQLERRMESITVVADEPRIFATNIVSEPMLAQQSAITSVLAVVDNLPGVSIQEGDTYGADDWSTSISMRGFQVHLDEAQIGTTIDGFPNGTSDYWSGSKANRFIDAPNMGAVQVSQGTADVASRSIEALGGTFDFATDDPAREQRYTAAVTLGDNEAQRYYLRLDTGALFGTGTYAWVSASRQESRDWVQRSVPIERDHLAAKLQSAVGRAELSAYFSFDDTDGPSYQRLFSAAEYALDPRWDRLIDTWTATPWVNQLYRAGWNIPRRNTFGYLKADIAATDVLTVSVGTYFHRQRGRGDWLPPYLVDVTDDGGGPESELHAGATVRGGDPLGRLHFVTPDGVRLAPAAGCVSSIIFPYGGAGPEHDPACHPANALPLQSYRHSHYGKDRWGLTLDEEWFQAVGSGGNRLRAGFWYEDSRRVLGRDWHKVIDARVDARFDATPYWQQYDWRFPQNIAKWYVEDTFYAGPFAFSGGVKQYLVSVGRNDLLGDTAGLEVDSDSDLLGAAGVTYTAPVDGLELFAGYSQNFKSLSDRLLEAPGRSLGNLRPETADNIDFGVRYTGDRVALTATYYDIDFRNRIFFLTPASAAGPNYLIPGGGAYFNAGGIESHGLELSTTVSVTPRTSLYAAYTSNHSSYIGTGDPLVDAAQGIRPGSDVVGVPETLWVLSLDRNAGPVATGLSAKYTSSRAITLDGAWRADAYWLVDAYLTYALDGISERLDGLELSLVANNLLDATYLATIAGEGAFLGTPRTISLNTTVSF